jgi:hypothetical protein
MLSKYLFKSCKKFLFLTEEEEKKRKAAKQFFDFDAWNAHYFFEGEPLKEFLSSQKQLIGQKIEAIFIMGQVFNYDDFEDGFDDCKQVVSLDEPALVKIGQYYFSVWFYFDSRVKIAFNSLIMKELSGYFEGWAWRDCTKLFKNGVIGRAIKGFEVKTFEKGFYDACGLGDRPDGGDYIDCFSFILDNGNKLGFQGDIEHMCIFAEDNRGNILSYK